MMHRHKENNVFHSTNGPQNELHTSFPPTVSQRLYFPVAASHAAGSWQPPPVHWIASGQASLWTHRSGRKAVRW